MCGRFVTPDVREIEDFWHIGRHNWRSPFEQVRYARFNVAPQQGNPQNYIPVIRADANSILELVDLQWWLLPSWSPEPRTKYSTFNARVETVATISSFREPFRRRRCLIPARGWYEWQQRSSGKQPWYFHATGGGLLAFAGVWDHWEQGGQTIDSCAIIVGESNATTQNVHSRMPLIIPEERQALWLSPDLTDPGKARELLLPVPDNVISLHPVGKAVGNARNDGPGLIEPLPLDALEAP